MSTLQVELVAADRTVWTGEAGAVFARSIEGDLGILPGHTPMLAVLVAGQVRVETGGATQDVQIDSGFLSVDRDRVTIVAERVDASSLSPNS